MWDEKISNSRESSNHVALQSIKTPLGLELENTLKLLVGFLVMGAMMPLFSCQPGSEPEFGGGLDSHTLVAPPVPPGPTPVTDPPPPPPPPPYVPSWQWENPLPQGNHLHAVWVQKDKSGNDEILAGGDATTLITSNGPLWNHVDLTKLNSDIFGTIHAISGQSSQGIVLAVQNSRNVYIRTDGTWTGKHTRIGDDGIEYYSVWATNNPEGDFFVVGGDASPDRIDTTFHGYVYHVTNQGATWTLELDKRAQALHGVFGTGSGTSMVVYAVGTEGAMFRRDSTGTWTELNPAHLDAPFNRDLSGVWATTTPNPIIYVVGTKGTIASSQDSGTTWKSESLPAEAVSSAFTSVWGFGKDVYVSGTTGTVLHGILSAGTTSWKVEAKGLAPGNLNSIWGQIKDGKIDLVCTVGDLGVMLQNRSGSWSSLSATRTPQTLNAGWARNASEVYTVGGQSAILRRDSQGTWSPEFPEAYDGTHDNPSLNAISGYTQDATSPAEIYAVGESGTILHRTTLMDGSPLWKYDGSYLTTKDWHGVWVGGNDIVYAVGDQGRIGRKSKVTAPADPWATLINLPDARGGTFTINNNLTAVLGVSDQHNQIVYIGDEKGSILRFDGSFWSQESLGTTDSVLAFMGADEKNLYAITKSAIFNRRTDGTWSKAYRSSNDILLTGTFIPQRPNTALLLGSSGNAGVVWRGDHNSRGDFGLNPPVIESYSLGLMNAIVANSDKDIYLFGQGGSILHYH